MAQSGAEKARQYRERRYAEIDAMPKIPCECGCGEMIPPLSKQLRPAKYKQGHQPGHPATQFKPGMEAWNKGLPAPWATATHKGSRTEPESIEKQKATRLRNKLAGKQSKRGWKHTQQTRAKFSEAQRRLGRSGPANPFYGKRHTAETKALLSQKLRGAGNPHWQGDAPRRSYGREFTRAYKRLILMRDNHTCQRCGKTATDVRLCVHHLDHNKLNNDPGNLVAACPSCNTWASYHRDMPFRPLS